MDVQRINTRANSTKLIHFFFNYYYFSFTLSKAFLFSPPQECTQSSRCQLVQEESALVPVFLVNKAVAAGADTRSEVETCFLMNS